MKFCPECGSKNDGFKFCSNCGYKFEASTDNIDSRHPIHYSNEEDSYKDVFSNDTKNLTAEIQIKENEFLYDNETNNTDTNNISTNLYKELVVKIIKEKDSSITYQIIDVFSGNRTLYKLMDCNKNIIEKLFLREELILFSGFSKSFSYFDEDYPYYEGEFKNAKYNGKGKYFYDWSGYSIEFYEGEWSNGKIIGNGKIFDIDDIKLIYQGEWDINSGRNGKGASYYRDGSVQYEGEWSRDRFHGFGKYYQSNNSVQEGFWVRGRMNGYGTMKYENGDFYEGDWEDDKRHGKGKLIWYNGDSLEGIWFKGELSSYGVLKFKSGNVYEGGWKKNVYHGTGKWITKDGSYTGIFENGNPIGDFMFTDLNGISVTGRFNLINNDFVFIPHNYNNKNIEKDSSPIMPKDGAAIR